MAETYYQKLERKAGEELEALLSKPVAPASDLIGVIDESTNEPEYFDPWDIFPVYGNYSSSFDDLAIATLTDILNGTYLAREQNELAQEMFREILCKKNLCDYGTSPRVCFPTSEFKKLLPQFIDKWKQYYKVAWSEDFQG